jgi:hypothetical protein
VKLKKDLHEDAVGKKMVSTEKSVHCAHSFSEAACSHPSGSIRGN